MVVFGKYFKNTLRIYTYSIIDIYFLKTYQYSYIINF